MPKQEDPALSWHEQRQLWNRKGLCARKACDQLHVFLKNSGNDLFYCKDCADRIAHANDSLLHFSTVPLQQQEFMMPLFPFSTALAAAQVGQDIQRTGWRNKNFKVKSLPCLVGTADGITTIELQHPVLCRVLDTGEVVGPWLPTEDDLFASDWLIEENPVPDKQGSFSWALEELYHSRPIAFGNGLLLKQGMVFGVPCIVLVLPNHAQRIWRPQHQDLWSTSYVAA